RIVIQCATRESDRVGGLLRSRASLIELRARHAHVVGLNREDSRNVALLGLVLNQRRGAFVAGDADILEEHATEQEVELVGERAEVVTEPGRLTDRGKATGEVNC